MTQQTPPTPRHAVLAVLIGLGCAGPALAEANPYSLGVSQTFRHDSNLFRAPDGTLAQSDLLSSTGVFAGLDQPFGRQRLRANASARHNRYQDSDRLNHNSWGLGASLDWEAASRLAGSLSYAANENQTPFGAQSGAALNQRNLEKSQQLQARVQYGLHSVLSLEGALAHRSLDYSAPQYAPNELRQNSASLGLRYRPSGLLALGTALRVTRGKSPFVPAGQTEGNRLEREDLDVTATWVPSGLSTLTARLSLSRQDNSAATDRDFSGATGALAWAWRPSGRLRFNTTLSRDTGTETGFQEFSDAQLGGVGDVSRVSTALSLAAVYEATAKIQFDANLRHVRRSLVQSFTTGGTTTGSAGTDNTSWFGIGARYAPLRSLLLACSLGRESRNASSTLSSPYDNNSASCMAQFTLN